MVIGIGMVPGGARNIFLSDAVTANLPGDADIDIEGTDHLVVIYCIGAGPLQSLIRPPPVTSKSAE